MQERFLKYINRDFIIVLGLKIFAFILNHLYPKLSDIVYGLIQLAYICWTPSIWQVLEGKEWRNSEDGTERALSEELQKTLLSKNIYPALKNRCANNVLSY